VQISVDGSSPAQGSPRYFRVEQAMSGEWLAIGKSDSYNGYSDLFPFL
jgi:hypothetical protein